MDSPKKVIDEIEKAAPGTRFQRLYRKRQQSRHGGAKNGIFIVGGLLLIGAGIATYAIPVIPSDLVILLGVAVLAQGFHWAARALDRAELAFRRHFGWLIAKWRRLPRWAKWAIYIAWLVTLSGTSWWIYHTLHD